MGKFSIEVEKLFEALGESKKMVLSTSDGKFNVTSRMMSIIIIEKEFYFQTDKNFRKYEQLQKNSNVSLCIDNIVVEGVCQEVNTPLENKIFCELYEKYFKSSYDKYTSLPNERLFLIKPKYIRKWIYEKGVPFQEFWDFSERIYTREEYII